MSWSWILSPTNGLLAQGSPDAGSSIWSALTLPLLIFGVFYFVLLRPMRNRQRKLKDLVGNLKRGEKVITNGGIFGTVMGISDRLIQLRIADGVTIEISRNAVAGLQSTDGPDNKDT